jgi:hypothetical protein
MSRPRKFWIALAVALLATTVVLLVALMVLARLLWPEYPED